MEITNKKDNSFFLDCTIPCSWLEEGEIKLSDYQELISYYVQKKLTLFSYAKTIRPKEFSY